MIITAPLKLRRFSRLIQLTSKPFSTSDPTPSNKETDFMRAVREKARLEKQRQDKTKDFFEKIRDDKSKKPLQFMTRSSTDTKNIPDIQEE